MCKELTAAFVLQIKDLLMALCEFAPQQNANAGLTSPSLGKQMLN
jgi:hypothetical protein